MKTPDEIKQGQKLCLLGTACGRCPYYNVGHGVAACMGRLTQDTLDYIQQLETEDAQQAQRIAGLEQELAAVKRERDAAVNDLEELTGRVSSFYLDCDYCKDKDKPVCKNYDWQWRGVCPENTEVQDGQSDA